MKERFWGFIIVLCLLLGFMPYLSQDVYAASGTDAYLVITDGEAEVEDPAESEYRYGRFISSLFSLGDTFACIYDYESGESLTLICESCYVDGEIKSYDELNAWWRELRQQGKSGSIVIKYRSFTRGENEVLYSIDVLTPTDSFELLEYDKSTNQLGTMALDQVKVVGTVHDSWYAYSYDSNDIRFIDGAVYNGALYDNAYLVITDGESEEAPPASDYRYGKFNSPYTSNGNDVVGVYDYESGEELQFLCGGCYVDGELKDFFEIFDWYDTLRIQGKSGSIVIKYKTITRGKNDILYSMDILTPTDSFELAEYDKNTNKLGTIALDQVKAVGTVYDNWYKYRYDSNDIKFIDGEKYDGALYDDAYLVITDGKTELESQGVSDYSYGRLIGLSDYTGIYDYESGKTLQVFCDDCYVDGELKSFSELEKWWQELKRQGATYSVVIKYRTISRCEKVILYSMDILTPTESFELARYDKSTNQLGTINLEQVKIVGRDYDSWLGYPYDTNDFKLIDGEVYDGALYVKPAKNIEITEAAYSNNSVQINVVMTDEMVEKSGVVVIALYDDDRLVDFTQVVPTLEINHTFENVEETEKPYTVKIMHWDNLVNLKPLNLFASAVVAQ